MSLIVGLISGDAGRIDWAEISLSSVLAMAYLILAGSLTGYMAYIWLLGIRRPSLVGTYAYVNPVVAVFLGWLVANEHISMQQVIALAIIIVGVILVNVAKR